MSNIQGSISHLFIKLKPGVSMTEMPQILVTKGLGIEQDINAHYMSPRQILIVRKEDLLKLAITPGELRENIVIEGITDKDFQPGAVLKIDNQAAIRLTFYCEPCKRIAHLVNSLKIIEKKRGILGVILEDGLIKIGDKCSLYPNLFPQLSDIPYQRFLEFLNKIPSGKVITYKQIITGIGVSQSYFRALPNYLQKANKIGYPVHRVLDSKGHLITLIKNQRQNLEIEGVKVMPEAPLIDPIKPHFVSLKDYLWQDKNLYLK